GDKEAVMETRYYISSLEPDPIIILKSIRSHWEVENNLHWVLDIGFREDDDRKIGNAAINFSAISKLALMLLKQSDIKLGMAGK
ncbi:ISAs1 family transposase, partial [Bacteroides fragilis]